MYAKALFAPWRYPVYGIRGGFYPKSIIFDVIYDNL